jgi:hypothetical protein
LEHLNVEPYDYIQLDQWLCEEHDSMLRAHTSKFSEWEHGIHVSVTGIFGFVRNGRTFDSYLVTTEVHAEVSFTNIT